MAFADALGGWGPCLARPARRAGAYLFDRELSLCRGLGRRAVRLHGNAVGAAARLLCLWRIAAPAGLGRSRLRRRGGMFGYFPRAATGREAPARSRRLEKAGDLSRKRLEG